MFATKVVGDEFGISGIAFVAAKFLLAVGLDATRVDEMKGGYFGVIEGVGDRFPVGSCLFKASGKLLEISQGFEPSEKLFDS